MPVFTDERGRLVAIEFGDLPFQPRRCFVVTAPGRQADRGGHAAECREVIVLLRGSVRVRLVHEGDVTECRLSEPGSTVLVDRHDLVDYQLESADTEILVLADQPFRTRAR
jgi:hypothetical protein